VIMGGLSFEPTYTVYVDFENPGGLQTGAPVKIAGVKVGRVAEMQFRGGHVEAESKQPVAPIRLLVKIEKKFQGAIHDNARFYVTSQGVLGEMFLAVEPGSHDRPIIQDGAVVLGVNPPRLDLLLSESYELLHRAYIGITNNEDKLKETFDGLHETLRGTGDFFKKNQGKLDNIVQNVESVSAAAKDGMKAARQRYVDGPQITRIMNNVERTTTTLDRDLEPMLRDGKKVASDASKLTNELASAEQLERYKRITRDLSDTSGHAKLAAADAQALVAHIKRGRGTVGALVMDEALYDDLQEMLRDLKHNPWKFFWRE